MKFDEKKIIVGRDVISYYDSLIGDTVLFFIHGSFLNKDYWQKQLYYFAGKYRIIAVDLAGHGKSGFNTYDFTIDRYGGDVVSIIDQLNLENVILIGHSIGADIMLSANQQSNKGIVGVIAIDYFGNVGTAIPEESIEQIMSDLRDNFPTTNADYARNTLLTKDTPHSIAERVLLDFRTANSKVGVPMNEDFFHYSEKEQSLLKELGQKLYMVNVDYQPTNQESLEKVVGDNYELQIISGTSHFPMIENPTDLNAAIETFIEKILKK